MVGAKFVPGFSTVGPPIAGSLRLPMPSFLAASGAGAALWAGAAILVGWLLRTEVRRLIDATAEHGLSAGFAVLVAVLAWWVWALWR